MNILSALYKAKKPLYCDKCGTSKKSVIGFLSHQSQCGESLEEVKVKCEFCDRRVLPVSMQSHVKLVHETPKENRVRKDTCYFDIDSGTMLTKRKAAKSALLVINKLSNETNQEHCKYYLGQVKFSEENFVEMYLRKELANNNIVRCKFNSCVYESDSVTNIVEHMNSCSVKPEQYFTCKKCLLITITEEEMREHFKKIHDIEIVDDEYQAIDNYEDAEDEQWEQYDMETKRASLHERSKMERDPSYKAKPTCVLNIYKSPNRLFSQAYNFTIEFCQKHYSKEEIFKHMYYSKSDWLLLDYNLMEEYWPKHRESCDVTRSVINRESDNYTFKKFELFETACIEGSATIFCGGPVQALAWMPTPFTSLDCAQVLAVAPLKDFDEKHLVNQCYNEPSLIQFWDFGVLKNKHPMNEPKLMFCLSFDYGPVWHMEWCPSGCFDSKPEENSAEMSRRMGLLAVAGSDSIVYIFSIPHLKDEQIGLIYKVKPLLLLCMAFGEEYYSSRHKFFASKISWTKASGHRYIAVGYTDGMVGLFDLEPSSLLSNSDTDDCNAVLPFKAFHAHLHMITAIDLIHLADGKRWLLTGSFDRFVTIWDLNNNLKIYSKRHIISDGVWLSHWLAFVTTADESSTNNNAVPTFLATYRDYLYERVNMVTSKSSVKSVSSSNWLNGILYGSSMGDIIAMFPSQLLYGLDYDKKIKSYTYLLGSTKLINKTPASEDTCAEAETLKSVVSETNKNNTQSKAKRDIVIENTNCPVEELFAYQTATKKYSLLFSDTKMDSYKDFIDQKITKDQNEFSKANLYPLHAINKVTYNPNLQASLYYAAGYQAGFVRVSYMKFLENDLQIK